VTVHREQQADADPAHQRGGHVTRGKAERAREWTDLVDVWSLASDEMIHGEEGDDLGQHRQGDEDHRPPFAHHRQHDRRGGHDHHDRQGVADGGDESGQIDVAFGSVVGHVGADGTVPVTNTVERFGRGDQHAHRSQGRHHGNQTDEEGDRATLHVTDWARIGLRHESRHTPDTNG
jgi:hypothetical protein